MKITIVAILMAVTGFAVGYTIFSSSEKQAMPAESVTEYTCGMHPEISSSEPGYCPLCNMKLTPRKESGSSGSIMIDPTTTQNMGLVAVPVVSQSFGKTIKAFGKVDFADQNIYSINMKVDGWIEKLFVNKIGQEVFAGQPLMEIYSPKLVTAQKELLIARESMNNSSEMIASINNNTFTSFSQNAKTRLKNLDISDDQIERLLVTGEIRRTMKIRAPYNGIVISKTVDEGARLKSGKEIFKIVDLSKVWVKAFIYEEDLPFVSLNQTAIVTFPNLPGYMAAAQIEYISPFLDENRQIEIRLELGNDDYFLKPEMYAEIELEYELKGNRLVIPRSSIINSGDKEIVYISEGDGAYSPREIKTGVIGENDLIEVISGLSENDSVVRSGQFLLDSESRLSEALGSGMGGHNHGGTDNDEHKKHGDVKSETTDMPKHDVYTCPMPEHFHIMQYGEGKCSECGMDLVLIYETKNDKAYVCPMPECESVSDKEGRCDKCGMNLKKLDKEMKHDQ